MLHQGPVPSCARGPWVKLRLIPLLAFVVFGPPGVATADEYSYPYEFEVPAAVSHAVRERYPDTGAIHWGKAQSTAGTEYTADLDWYPGPPGDGMQPSLDHSFGPWVKVRLSPEGQILRVSEVPLGDWPPSEGPKRWMLVVSLLVGAGAGFLLGRRMRNVTSDMRESERGGRPAG